MSLNGGLFIVTANKENSEAIDKEFWASKKSKIQRTDAGKVVVWTYRVADQKEFDFLLTKLLSCGETINIFEGTPGAIAKAGKKVASKILRK